MSSAALKIEALTVRFGGVKAVKGVDLEVAEGRLAGLIGPNGAGKTTLVDAVSGFLPNEATGKVTLTGRDITDLSAHERAREGLARTWQAVELFDDITVRENIAVAAHDLTLKGSIKDFFSRSTHDDVVEETLERLELHGVADSLPRDLSMGMRKLAGVARAIARRPSVLLLDEPAAGLDSTETRWLGGRLTQLNEQGISMLLIDHDMNLVMNTCHEVHVLQFGELVASGSPEQIQSDQRVIDAYLGGSER